MPLLKSNKRTPRRSNEGTRSPMARPIKAGTKLKVKPYGGGNFVPTAKLDPSQVRDIRLDRRRSEGAESPMTRSLPTRKTRKGYS